MPQYCWEPDCEKHAYYNYPGRTRPIFCKTHADSENGMIYVRRCKNKCGKQTQGGLNGLCISCARKDGWDGIRNECKNKCGKEELHRRQNKLGEFIEKCISDQTKSGIFRLFYDE